MTVAIATTTNTSRATTCPGIPHTANPSKVQPPWKNDCTDLLVAKNAFFARNLPMDSSRGNRRRRIVEFIKTARPNLNCSHVQMKQRPIQLQLREDVHRNQASSVIEPSAKTSRVTFSTMATVHYRQKASDEEIKNTWYDDDDYASFESNRYDTVRAFHTEYNGNVQALEDKGQDTVLGLEKTLTRRLSLQRKYHTMEHNFAVLEQQSINRRHKNANQVDYDTTDAHALRVVSEQFSKLQSADELTTLGCIQSRIELIQTRNELKKEQRSRQQILTDVLDQALSITL